MGYVIIAIALWYFDLLQPLLFAIGWIFNSIGLLLA